MSAATLASIVADLEAGRGASSLGIAIALGWKLHPRFGDQPGYWATPAGPTFRALPDWLNDLTAAWGLIPAGCNYIFGAGRARATEPLFGAQVFEPTEERVQSEAGRVIGEAETDIGLPACIVIAALKAEIWLAEKGARA